MMHAASQSPTLHACNCMGPQNGEPMCPCMMHQQRRFEAEQRERVLRDVARARKLLWEKPVPSDWKPI